MKNLSNKSVSTKIGKRNFNSEGVITDVGKKNLIKKIKEFEKFFGKSYKIWENCSLKTIKEHFC